MIFLIEYNRSEGKLVNFRRFESSERRAAQEAKLELELELHGRREEHEVVLLEADSEDALRQGYRRYFEDLPTLLRSTIEQLKVLETR